VLAALPGARVYELDGTGITERRWAELDLVRDWQSFFDAPAGCCTTWSTTGRQDTPRRLPTP
jgi:predicted ATPase